MTLSSPSASQKRVSAKGRSAETVSIVTFSTEVAFSLNALTDFWHTPVSMLGKIFNKTVCPLKSSRATSERSPFTSSKSGALLPTAGSSPRVSVCSPFNVMIAIHLSN